MMPTPITPLSDAERAELEAKWNEHPGLKHIGARVDLSKPDVVRMVVDPIQAHHRGGLGTEAVNGAVIAAVFDFTIGLVGHLHAHERGGTAQINVHFIRPVHGDWFEVLGRLVRAGRSLVFATAELLDEQGKLCARCDGIVAVAGEPARDKEEMAL